MSSTRLPGKVMKKIIGRPMLELQIERILQSETLDKLIVATSTAKDDDVIVELCRKIEIDYFRGSLDDVLGRYYQAAKYYRAEHIVRLTGDCPLTDPCVIDKVVLHYLSENCDYASNTLERTYPDGLDVEVFSFETLESAHMEAISYRDREHVVPFIKRGTDRFRLCSICQAVDLSENRWTVDVEDDFKFVVQIYESLYHENGSFAMEDILDLLKDRPEIIRFQKYYKPR